MNDSGLIYEQLFFYFFLSAGLISGSHSYFEVPTKSSITRAKENCGCAQFILREHCVDGVQIAFFWQAVNKRNKQSSG
jgi:hypothetical protein